MSGNQALGSPGSYHQSAKKLKNASLEHMLHLRIITLKRKYEYNKKTRTQTHKGMILVRKIANPCMHYVNAYAFV